jgi:hypothetical protein
VAADLRERVLLVRERQELVVDLGHLGCSQLLDLGLELPHPSLEATQLAAIRAS